MDDSKVHLISYCYALPGLFNDSEFDKVADDTIIPPITKKLILYSGLFLWNIPGMGSKNPEQLESYYSKFIAATGDTAAIEKLKADFAPFYETPENVKTGDMVLTDLHGETTTLENVIAKHKGKIRHVDFWANWCGPCVGSMLEALKLREEYQDKDVAFIYLALNDKEDKWRAAVDTYRTDHLGENYFITNPKSDLLAKLKITQIPRYVIFDRSGGIVDSNAPRPKGMDIRKI